MTTVLARRRGWVAAIAALLCVLVASPASAIAAAEEDDTAPIRTVSENGLTISSITGPSSPERYPIKFELGETQTMRQVSETEVAVEYPSGVVAFTVRALLEHAADGARVPSTLSLSEGDVVTFIVHHREGNPAAGFAPFAYPITEGEGWEGGYRPITVVGPEDEAARPAATVPAPSATAIAPQPTAAAPTCTVPSLHGLSLRAAKVRLRSAGCAIGPVHLARGATAAKGDVVKQFQRPGKILAAGASVAVKLG